MGYVLLFLLGVIVLIISSVAQGVEYIFVNFKAPISIAVGTIICIYLLFKIYEKIYFSSKKFKEIKNGIQKYIDNCNELNHHIEDLKGAYINIKSYDFGSGTIKDNSDYNYQRKEWSKSEKTNQIHHCSASVCKNANDQPFKYLCKYFDIEKTDESLSSFENVLNDFAAAEQGKTLLQNEKNTILKNAGKSIPWLINNFSKARLIRELGFEDVDLSDLHFPIYTFQYVSAGGNSSLKVDIKLDVDNLDKLVLYLRDLIKYRKSVAGQRALMTSRLREEIKERDGYTCKICGLSTVDEKNLLLEIDHITPLSKGGMTTLNNLQTLCWRCNRTKGSKFLV